MSILTGPQWIRRPREALAKDPSSTSPRAAVDIEGADTVDGEVATERIVPVPKLGLQPKLAPGLSNRLKEVDLVYHRLVLEVFLGHQNHSLNFHLLYGWYSVTSRDHDSIVACFDQRTRCSGESPSTTT